MIASVVTNMVVCLAITTTHSLPATSQRAETNRVEIRYEPIDDEQRDPSPKGYARRTRGIAFGVFTLDYAIYSAYGNDLVKFIPLSLIGDNGEISNTRIGWVDLDMLFKAKEEILGEPYFVPGVKSRPIIKVKHIETLPEDNGTLTTNH